MIASPTRLCWQASSALVGTISPRNTVGKMAFTYSILPISDIQLQRYSYVLLASVAVPRSPNAIEVISSVKLILLGILVYDVPQAWHGVILLEEIQLTT